MSCFLKEKVMHKVSVITPVYNCAQYLEEAIASVHTPIGTPIRAVTPEEIAVSIAGEMILCRAERRGDKPHGCPMH